MANQWVVVMSSEEYGQEVYKYDSPKEQLEGATRLTQSAQKHSAVDNICRSITIIPDPYRGRQEIEDFIEAYL